MGLVNNTTNTIKDIVQKKGIDIKKDLLQVLLVAINQYSRPILFTNSNSKKVIPIFSTLCKWEGSKGTCLYCQFPIILIFAFTIYKSQRLILNWAVLDINRKEYTIRLTYIGILQVKKVLGLIFEQGFNKKLFNPIASANKQEIGRAHV